MKEIELRNVKGCVDYSPREQYIRNYISDTLKKVFEDLRAVQEGTAFFITYWNGLMIPTGEEDLFRITITLNTNEWKGA